MALAKMVIDKGWLTQTDVEACVREQTGTDKDATVGRAAVHLPDGHGIVTFGDRGATERVFFPAGQVEFDLVGGAIERLVREGLAKRYGRLK